MYPMCSRTCFHDQGDQLFMGEEVRIFSMPCTIRFLACVGAHIVSRALRWSSVQLKLPARSRFPGCTGGTKRCCHSARDRHSKKVPREWAHVPNWVFGLPFLLRWEATGLANSGTSQAHRKQLRRL
jgi:hypothetical protein